MGRVGIAEFSLFGAHDPRPGTPQRHLIAVEEGDPRLASCERSRNGAFYRSVENGVTTIYCVAPRTEATQRPVPAPVRPIRYLAVPQQLQALPRWVRYSAGKVPLTTSGRGARVNTPRTWTTYADALASNVGVGIGFVLNGDGIVCVDIDHCIVDGRLLPWAAELLDKFPPTWVEVSPSGDGLHVWGLADLKQAIVRPRADGGRVEVYGAGRYLTVTGKRWGAAPLRLAQLGDAIAACR